MPLLYIAMDQSSVLGIDVASEKLDMYWTDGMSHQYEKVPYTIPALNQFRRKHPHINAQSCTVGMESTGDYQIKAARYFLQHGFAVKIMNPVLTKHYTKTTIRGAKTDKKDAELIARLIREGHGTAINLAVLSNEKKELLRLSTMLVHTSTRIKLRLQALKRKELAGAKTVEKKLAKIITTISDYSHELVDTVTQEQTQKEQLIDSIPGFATKLSAVVSEELGDVTRFHNAKSLVAYAGLDPRIKQSGKSLNTTGRLTKRGSSHLRAALFIAANVAYHRDTELKAYYDKKKSEGRTHTEVLCMLARKLLYRIYAVLKNNRPYELR